MVAKRERQELPRVAAGRNGGGQVILKVGQRLEKKNVCVSESRARGAGEVAVVCTDVEHCVGFGQAKAIDPKEEAVVGVAGVREVLRELFGNEGKSGPIRGAESGRCAEIKEKLGGGVH